MGIVTNNRLILVVGVVLLSRPSLGQTSEQLAELGLTEDFIRNETNYIENNFGIASFSLITLLVTKFDQLKGQSHELFHQTASYCFPRGALEQFRFFKSFFRGIQIQNNNPINVHLGVILRFFPNLRPLSQIKNFLLLRKLNNDI